MAQSKVMTSPDLTDPAHSSTDQAAESQPPIPGKMETPKLTVRLVRRHAENPRRDWDNDLYHAERGTWRLTGPAGSGVTSLLLDTVARRIEAGEDPERILIVAASKQAASRLRRGIVARVATSHYNRPAPWSGRCTPWPSPCFGACGTRNSG